MVNRPACYEFPPFRVDVPGKRLFHSTKQEINLTPLAAKLLIHLIERATEVVPKEELINQLWPRTFVTDGSLTNLKGELKAAFKENDSSREYIKTYRGRGYSFNISVRACDGSHQGLTSASFKRDDFYNNFVGTFKELLTEALNAELFFISSNRWRGNHMDDLLEFLQRNDSSLTIYLPNLENQILLNAFKSNFDEGEKIEGLIRDAYAAFAEVYFAFPGKISIRSYNVDPGYSFYRFDQTLIVSMYPITPQGKHGVPTFQVEEGSKYWPFFLRDLETLREITPLGATELEKFLH